MHKFGIQAYVKSYVFTTSSSKTVVPLSKGKQKIKKTTNPDVPGIYNATL